MKLTYLAFALSVLCPVALAGTGPVSGEKKAYLNALKQTHQVYSDREALIAEANMLLKHYALRDGLQAGHVKATNRLYQLSIQHPGELTVRSEHTGTQGIEIISKRYSVFGLDPYVHYGCDNSFIACELYYPGDNSPWLMITRDRKGAGDLAKVISYLLRDLQKG